MRRRLIKPLTLLLALLAGVTAAQDAAPPAAKRASGDGDRAEHRLSGFVLDASGAPVPGATVRVEIGGVPTAEATTGADGGFNVSGLVAGSDGVAGPAILRATAPGLAQASVPVNLDSPALDSLQIVLHPAPLAESVAVTATRGAQRLETPESVSVLTSAELLAFAAPTVDDALRSTPGFSLFRRSSSRIANPTTQGVTLRGVSGSGASRTLVLADGIPLNDPFGSWVYWNRIPQAAIDRVEVLRGAAGDLYGADALGGVIQVLTFAPDRSRIRAILDVASRDTARASLFGGGRWRGWTGTIAGERLSTDGAPGVARAERGKADVAAGSDYRTAFATLGRDAPAWRARVRASVYGEDRANGTPLQVNTSDWRQLSGEASGSGARGSWLLRGAGGSQSYYQTFSAVSTDRSSERLTSAQRTRSSFGFLGGHWIRPWRSHVLLLGVEARQTRSEASETRYSLAGVASSPFLTGGRERIGSVFGRAALEATDRLTIGMGARGDLWQSDPSDAMSPEHAVGFFSPRASLSWRLGRRMALHASAYRAHRTPTLNELHRDFRVGNVLTGANPLLEPERLTGIEAGLLVSGRRASGRITGFLSRLDDAVANVTLRTTPALITRQRQNAGSIRAVGIEVEADLRPHPKLVVNAVAVVTASRFRGTPKLPALEDKRVPQVPRYQLGVSATYADPRVLTLWAQVRLVGAQFDDDLNELPLKGFTVVDLSASRAIGRRLHAFLAVENALDVEYDVGRTPVRTVGWPRTLRAGVRVFLP